MAFDKRSDIKRPLARVERLLVENIDDETVVYDEETKTAHALKPLAAAVFLYANGENEAAQIAELASYRLGTQVSEAEVTEAVEQLRAAALLSEPQVGGVSRRTALKTFAATSIAAGAGSLLITSVATAGTKSNGNCPPGGYSANSVCGKNGAVLGSCTPCHQQSDCSSGYVCAVVPCDGASVDCGQTVCVPTKTATSNGFTTLPANVKYCPSGYRYFMFDGYAYKCCGTSSPIFYEGCETWNLYTSMVDGSLSCGCSGTVVNNSQCCPSGYQVVNGVCRTR